jgi:hypothetical protein
MTKSTGVGRGNNRNSWNSLHKGKMMSRTLKESTTRADAAIQPPQRRYCINCQYHFLRIDPPPKNRSRDFCGHEQVAEPVRGDEPDCATARAKGSACGPDGALFFSRL